MLAMSAPDSDALRVAWLPSYIEVLRTWLMTGRSVRLPLSGHSMRPSVDAGAWLAVATRAPGALAVGDLIVYEDGGRLVCHRVLRRLRRPDGLHFLTKGDGVSLASGWISASAVLGCVVAI